MCLEKKLPIVDMKPGFVEFKKVKNRFKLDDLWIFIGSRCNLSCKHCYVESSPSNNTLEMITLSDLKSVLPESQKYKVNHIYFTGGEPFYYPQIMSMLEESLNVSDVTVLTNATKPIQAYLRDLQKLNESGSNSLDFRISLDHHIKEKHEAIRGEYSFDRTISNTQKLCSLGFKPIITASGIVYEENTCDDEIVKKFKELFLPNSVDVKLLPRTLEMGANLERISEKSKPVNITRECMKNRQQEDFQCHNGRTIQKINGNLKVYPCPILYNDAEFELADLGVENLADSFKAVNLTHHECYYFCYKSGGACTN